MSTVCLAAMAFQRLSIDRDDPFDFLKLPRETRDEIHVFLLLTDYEIVMHPEEYEFPTYLPLELTITRACHCFS